MSQEVGNAYLEGHYDGAGEILAGIWGRVLREGSNPELQSYLIGMHEDLRNWHRDTTPRRMTEIEQEPEWPWDQPDLFG